MSSSEIELRLKCVVLWQSSEKEREIEEAIFLYEILKSEWKISIPWMSNWIWAESASFRFLSVTHYWLGQIQVNASSQQTLGSSISLSLSLSLPLILNFSVLNLSFLCSVFRFPIVDETENLFFFSSFPPFVMAMWVLFVLLL